MNNLSKIEPHAAALEAEADAMDADGIGGHRTRGHAAVLRDMASCMRAEAAQGKTPYSFADMHAADYAEDTSSQRFAARPQDDARQVSIISEATAGLRRIGLSPGDKLDLGTLDRALTDHQISTSNRIRLKGLCHQCGIL